MIKDLLTDSVITVEGAIDRLETGICHLEFTKADGTLRSMWATRCLAHVPDERTPRGDVSKTKSNKVVPVFDLEINEWRSFSRDRLLTIG